MILLGQVSKHRYCEARTITSRQLMRSHLKHFTTCTNWLIAPSLRILVLYFLKYTEHCSNSYLGDKSRSLILVLLAFLLIQVSCHMEQ